MTKNIRDMSPESNVSNPEISFIKTEAQLNTQTTGIRKEGHDPSFCFIILSSMELMKSTCVSLCLHLQQISINWEFPKKFVFMNEKSSFMKKEILETFEEVLIMRHLLLVGPQF